MRVPVSLIPHQQPRPATFALALLLLPVVIGLPIAVWLDLRSLSARMMQGEASGAVASCVEIRVARSPA
jgi:hypothetical protein